MPSCTVVGRIVCGKKPLPDIKVKIELKNRPGSSWQVVPTKPKVANVVTDKNGWYGVTFDVPTASMADALGGYAFVDFTCPDGKKVGRRLKVIQSKLSNGVAILKKIRDTVTEALIQKLFNLKTIPVVLSPDLVGLLAFEESYDCCKK